MRVGKLKRYAYGWITVAFFAGSLGLHWMFGWYAYKDEAAGHGQAPQVREYMVEMGRDTFENWQSEFLQLIWQVLGLADFLYVGSPTSKENDDRLEAKATRSSRHWIIISSAPMATPSRTDTTPN